MSNWEKQKKDENKGIVIAGIVLIIVSICWLLTGDGGFTLIYFLPIPNWLYALAGIGVGGYLVYAGLFDKL